MYANSDEKGAVDLKNLGEGRSTRLKFWAHVSVRERGAFSMALGFPTVVGGSVLKEKEIRKDSGWEGLGGKRSFSHAESETLMGRVGIEMCSS